jgi:hypothetical protein
MAAQSYGWAPDQSAQSVKGGVFDGARLLVWVYGWAAPLIHSTDTTVTTHDGGESVEGWLLAAPSAFKVTIRSLRRHSKVDGKSIQTKLGSDAVRFGQVDARAQQMDRAVVSRQRQKSLGLPKRSENAIHSVAIVSDARNGFGERNGMNSA